MEYKNIQNSKDNDDFKRFILKTIIWTILLTVSGIFLFPFLGWIIGKCYPVFVMLIVFTSIGALFLIVWLVHFVLGIIKTHTSHFRFNLPIPKPSQKLLVLSFSVIIVCGANILIDIERRVMFDAYGERWGNSTVTSFGSVHNMFGVRKMMPGYYDHFIDGGDLSFIYRMYGPDNKKNVLVLNMKSSKVYERVEDEYYEGGRSLYKNMGSGL